MRLYPAGRRLLIVFALALVALAGGGANAVLGVCGPFGDVSDAVFCPFVLEVFTLGITTGTTPTTYAPADSVTRLQMAVFLSRTVDGVLKRGGPRAAMKRFWTPQNGQNLGLTTVGLFPQFVDMDGADLWTSSYNVGSVSRVRASDGKLLETWTGASNGQGVLALTGRVLVAGNSTPGKLYRIDPTQPAGAVTTVASNLGGGSVGIAYDGASIWTANNLSSISIVTPGATVPWSAATVGVGFSTPQGILFDGANIWVTDIGPGTLLKLDSGGAILQTVTVGLAPYHPVFDGTNIWVPNSSSNTVSVVRASNGAVLATLTANGMNAPVAAGFDGQRILVANDGANVVSLWKAADLTPLGSIPIGAKGGGVCSDGLNFWITLPVTNQLARF